MFKLFTLLFYLTLVLVVADERHGNIDKLSCSIDWVIGCGGEVFGKGGVGFTYHTELTKRVEVENLKTEGASV